MIWAFATLATCCAMHDAWLTLRRIRTWGPAIELNGLTQFCCAKVGPQKGVVLSVLLPHILWTIVATGYDWATAYIFYTGYLSHLFVIQRASLAWEDELKAELEKSKNSEQNKLGGGKDAPPPASDAGKPE